MAVLPNNVLITGSKDKFIKFWNLDSYECTKRILARLKISNHFSFISEDYPTCSMAVLPNNVLVSGLRDKSLKFWNLDSYQCMKHIEMAHDFWITCLAVLPNNVLVSGSGDKLLEFWHYN